MSWLPMRTAPRDGTIILVCGLSHCSESGYVLPAAWLDKKGTGERWWAADVITVNHAPLPERFDDCAMTPLCWQPIPEPESYENLRRRSGQILSRKFRRKAP